jgi:hypothetical protein
MLEERAGQGFTPVRLWYVHCDPFTRGYASPTPCPSLKGGGIPFSAEGYTGLESKVKIDAYIPRGKGYTR